MSEFVLPEFRSPVTIETSEDESGAVVDHIRQLDIFNDALRECNRALEILISRLNNRVFIKGLKTDQAKDIVNPLHLITENLDINLEFSVEDSGKNIFARIWDAIKDFFRKIHRWLFGFKAVTKRYFSNMHNNLKHYKDLAKKLEKEIHGKPDHMLDLELLRTGEISYHYNFNSSMSLYEASETLSKTFDVLTDYIRDPEHNDEAKLLEKEKDTTEASFRVCLGVTIISNEKEKLGPSRLEIKPLNALYPEKKQTYESFGLGFDSPTIKQLEVILNTYDHIATAALKLDETFLTIQNSYDTLDRELKEVQLNKTMDLNTAARRTRVLIMAKDHIMKSKALIEAFVGVYNLEVKNVTNILDFLNKVFKK